MPLDQGAFGASTPDAAYLRFPVRDFRKESLVTLTHGGTDFCLGRQSARQGKANLTSPYLALRGRS